MQDTRLGEWDRQLEQGLPDCRLKYGDRDKARYRYGMLVLDTVYCASCGEPSAGTWPDCPHIFFICDRCVGRNGRPPGTAKVIDRRTRM